MLARHPPLAVLAVLAAGLAACGDARPLQADPGGGGGACTSCHGTSGRVGTLPGTDPNLAAAPPIAPAGEPAQVIGAHLAHLNPAAGSLSGPIACSECHLVPTNAGHATNPPAQAVQFGTLATGPVGTNPGTPTWNSPDKVTNTTCSNVYCHGSFSWSGVTGILANAPDWTASGQPACTSCHAMPPTGHVPLSGTVTPVTCHGCHSGTVDAGGLIVVNALTGTSLHVNGQKDVDGTIGCTTCHGGTDNTTGAPPTDLTGNTATTARGVGAHTSHVEAGPLAGAFGCVQCHQPVTALDSPGHNNGAVDVPFGDLAKTGGVTPAWNPGAAGGPNCSSVYCHGNFPGGSNALPIWTRVGQGEAACGTCHGTPPTSNHPSIGALTCNACHAGTANPDGTIDVAGGLHVNGVFDVKAHPDPDWATASGGNHTAAALDQATPFESCLQCHQNFGSAFGIAGSSCNDCHQQAATAGGWATTNWQQNCVFCHGDRSRIATWTGSSPAYEVAPPRGALGETLTTDIAVGAHQKHVNPTANLLSNAIACTECHASPLPADIGHVDGVAGVPLSGPLTTTPTGTFTPNPSWNAGTRGCAATYCHGNYPQGGNNATPVWTTVNGSFAACNSCHGAPPNTGEHNRHVFQEGYNCSQCHNGIATGSGNSAPIANGVIVNEALHVNGVRNVAFSLNPANATWTPAPTAQNAAAGSCSNVQCHNTRSW